MNKTKVHTGTVGKIEEDYTQILVKNPEGQKYKRFFSTETLAAAGINQPHQEVTLLLTQQSSPGLAAFCVFVIKGKEIDWAEIERELTDIKAGLDLDKIRTKFGVGGK